LKISSKGYPLARNILMQSSRFFFGMRDETTEPLCLPVHTLYQSYDTVGDLSKKISVSLKMSSRRTNQSLMCYPALLTINPGSLCCDSLRTLW